MVMTQAVARLNFRVPKETETLLKTAAKSSNQSLTGFVISAAEERAQSVLASYSLVPDGYFEKLIQALDETPVPNDALRRQTGINPVFKQQ
jgi:uncharacterized protein (DUF1778 family)